LFVYPNSPAEKVGLQVGDKILNISGERINDFYKQTEVEDISQIFLTIERNDEIMQILFPSDEYTYTIGGKIGASVTNLHIVPTNRFTIIREHIMNKVLPPQNDDPLFGQKYFSYFSSLIEIIAGFVLVIISSLLLRHRRT
jgi:membrane-associated protease RseP (regulator of RpoE activity)